MCALPRPSHLRASGCPGERTITNLSWVQERKLRIRQQAETKSRPGGTKSVTNNLPLLSVLAAAIFFKSFRLVLLFSLKFDFNSNTVISKSNFQVGFSKIRVFKSLVIFMNSIFCMFGVANHKRDRNYC